MCEFCENSKIITQRHIAYFVTWEEREVILSNRRFMKIKFGDMLDRPIPETNMQNMVEMSIKFCPICGRKLVEMEK